jgi:SAM-dependent methyltransferase
MVSLDRWRAAQAYERGFWESLSHQIADGAVPRLDWYQWRADQLVERLERLGLQHLTDGTARVVEVGCGPVGVVPFFPAAERVAVDPLDASYAANPVLAPLRSPTTDYREGAGERLPCESGRYDLAIMENCIDHVQDVGAVMSELRRVLKPDGILYMTVNARTRWGFGVHRLLSRLRVDTGHPYTFTPRRAQALLARHRFQPLSFEVESYIASFRADLQSSELRARIKALLGVSEFPVTTVARVTPTDG